MIATVVLADHSIVDTAPFFLPAFLVVGVLVAIVVRDRMRHRDDDEPGDQAPEEDNDRAA